MNTLLNNRTLIWLGVVTLSLFITACGELSYKRGASMTDFNQEKKSCASQYSDQKDIDTCLEKTGWVIVSADKPLIKEADSTPKSSAQINTGSEEKRMEVKTNPLDPIAVNSWWKAGSGPNQLIDDSNACIETLGEDYRIKSNMSKVTRGVLNCMKDKGWFAVEAP
jgi:hypothetical protein